jgi:preprotein translocase subunit SecD
MWLGAITLVLYGALAWGVASGATTFAPGLALDLAGGRAIILTPETESGETVEESDLEQAVEIIRRRVDANGVAEAEITVQGSNIVVSLPGNPDAATVDLVKQAAQLQFRPVLIESDPSPFDTASITDPNASATPSAEPAPVTSPGASATPAPATTPEPTVSASPAPTGTPVPEPVFGETDPSSFEWLTDALYEEYGALDCTDPVNFAGRTMGDPETGYVACTAIPSVAKLVMGPVELDGGDVETATSGPELTATGTLTGFFQVNIDFTSEGGAKFSDVTTRLLDLESPRNQFAMVLDGVVISHPQVLARITGGTATITGNFSQAEAEQLANQLKFGALPLTLTVQSEQDVSATLGADQLRNGLIAGAIGLILVVLYSFFQYRALAIVTIGSLLIAGLVTFGVISLLSWTVDYRLSLAGVAGLIVAIGITADSFIVYFERVRDELREGRSLASATDHAWSRARRTILASDAVSLLAALTLYAVSVGGVRGFAFTLGLTTLVDILVVFLFTHPILRLLATTKFFGEGHPWSGLDPKQLGRDTMYKGRGRVVLDASRPTLAERKAAERKAAAQGSSAEQKGGE